MSEEPWGQLVAQWVRWMVAGGSPATTVELRRYYVQRLCRTRPHLLDLSVDDLAEWIASEDWSANTRKSVRSALRCFYAWAVHTGRLESSPAHLLPPVRIPRARPKPAPEEVYRRALATSDERARLAVRLAGQCGLRRGEIAAVHASDVEQDLVGYSLRVVGKGSNERLVPLTDDLAEQVLARGGWAFPSPAGGHLTPHHLGKVVMAALEGACSTHALRHRAATIAYAGTHDLRAVQELLGHSRPETTAGYVKVPDDAVRAAMLAAAA